MYPADVRCAMPGMQIINWSTSDSERGGPLPVVGWVGGLVWGGNSKRSDTRFEAGYE
jgi:hypothetical protein